MVSDISGGVFIVVLIFIFLIKYHLLTTGITVGVGATIPVSVDSSTTGAEMDSVDLVAAAAALVLTRLGWAVARTAAVVVFAVVVHC